MVLESRCPHCQAAVSPQATFCRACKKQIPAVPGASVAPSRSPRPAAAAPPTILTPSARRSLVIERLSLSAALSGLVCVFLGLLSLSGGDTVTGALAGSIGAGFLVAAYLGRTCHPIGRHLLIGYSVFLLIGFPVGTWQAVFQILHLVKPEAKLIFEGRDRFSATEARQIATFRTANPWLASWLRFVNFLAIIAMVGMAAAIAIPMLTR